MAKASDFRFSIPDLPDCNTEGKESLCLNYMEVGMCKAFQGRKLIHGKYPYSYHELKEACMLGQVPLFQFDCYDAVMADTIWQQHTDDDWVNDSEKAHFKNILKTSEFDGITRSLGFMAADWAILTNDRLLQYVKQFAHVVPLGQLAVHGNGTINITGSSQMLAELASSTTSSSSLSQKPSTSASSSPKAKQQHGRTLSAEDLAEMATKTNVTSATA